MLGSISDITERKLAEEAVKAGEARLASLIATAMDGIVSTDEHQTIVLFNQAAEHMFGYKCSEMIGTPIGRLIPEQFRNAHTGHMDAFDHSPGGARHMGLRGPISGLRADGTEFPIEASISQTVISGKKLSTVILRDVTERKRTEVALRESVEHFSRAFNGNPTGMAIRRLRDDVILDVNPRFEQLVGYSRDELVGARVGDFSFYLRPDLRENVLRQAHGTEPVRDMELDLRDKDGTVKHVLMSVDLITLNGEPCALANFFDVTDRQQAEDALRRSERQYRELMEQAADAIFVFDRDGRFVDVNPAACEMAGYSREELLGLRIADVVDERDLRDQPLRLDIVRAGDTPQRRHGRTDRTERAETCRRAHAGHGPRRHRAEDRAGQDRGQRAPSP
jgi:hypothetical protein